MHDRADAEDESEGGVGVEEDNQLKDIHVGVDFLVDGVTKAFIRFFFIIIFLFYFISFCFILFLFIKIKKKIH